MKIIRSAIAGTLESSDIQVTVEPYDKGKVLIDLDSVVEKQFGDQIRALIREEVEKAGVKSCRIVAVDKGALDFAIRARLQSALYQGAELSGRVAWEGM